MGVWSSSQDIIIHNYNNLKNIIYRKILYLYIYKLVFIISIIGK